ncbi:unnamed protein product [Mytilus edulis]|uniref:B box-type domain-containing protein n=1 Tax=Mytilus edulis TaxID=6550 RepID=A0A8S3S7U7_MYTED|nr:unnamed protein product [Mytilus edulis]
MAQAAVNKKAQERLDRINVTCSIHFEKYYCLFCQKCKLLVCPQCIADRHNGHKVQDLNKTCTKRRTHLEESKTTIKSMIDELQTTQNKIEIVSETILTQKDILTTVINKHTTELVEQLDREVELINSSFDEERRQLKEKKKVLKEKLKDRKKIT